ncbi:unnamed protein product [Ceutorhynchus assimilis]|uniref:Uncharacterized protein n=1 Tax=Ceutorhynchus assimilis TaxID=467358 RepID=A0A9P0DJ84_9CUCU|nr:unnamed protein product [Ceutorhynchus assimilis]
MFILHQKYYIMVLILWLSTLDVCRSIMVEFGTSKGPILPKEPSRSSIQPKKIVTRSPAPVREIQEDIPNPNRYQPLVPQQYRTKLYAVKPNPNLILGTPLDQKYNPSLQKYNLYRKQYSRNLGPDYTGPHTFGKQDYELYEVKKTTLQPSVKYSEQDIQHRFKTNQQQNYVPQIGVIYSGGVRYYVPQIVYFTPNQESGEEENSVYDKNDEKYYVYNRQ